ncbi:LuxR C-terminal-related transcriptional regulator [Caenispirillum salinarum]|uniref:response regulator transcription factor n=1 Tax=Caenispirillum salinarum TaxID=859058 RepID=UPI00384D3F50
MLCDSTRLRLEPTTDPLLCEALAAHEQAGDGLESVLHRLSADPGLKDGLTNLYSVDMSTADPLGFAVQIGEMGVDMRGSLSTLGDYPDRRYILDNVAPHYAIAKSERRAALYRVRSRIQDRFAVYDRLILPTLDGESCLSLSRIRLVVEDAVSPVRQDGLTMRERQCLSLLASGLMTKEIAFALGLSVRTVEKHIESLKRHFGARTTAQAVARGILAEIAMEDRGRSGG